MPSRRKPRLAESPDLYSVNLIEDVKRFDKKLLANGAKEHEDPDFDPTKSSRRAGKGRKKKDSSKSKRRRATKRVSTCPPKRPRHFDADDDGEVEVVASAVNGQRDEKESPSKKRNFENLKHVAKDLLNVNGVGAKRSTLLSDSCNALHSSRRIFEGSDSPALGSPKKLVKLDTTSDESSLHESSLQESPHRFVARDLRKRHIGNGMREELSDSASLDSVVSPMRKARKVEHKKKKKTKGLERQFLSRSRAVRNNIGKNSQKQPAAMRGLGNEFDQLNQRGALEQHLQKEERLRLLAKKRKEKKKDGKRGNLYQRIGARMDATENELTETITPRKNGPVSQKHPEDASNESILSEELKALDTDEEPAEGKMKTDGIENRENEGVVFVSNEVEKTRVANSKILETDSESNSSLDKADEHLKRLADFQKMTDPVPLALKGPRTTLATNIGAPPPARKSLAGLSPDDKEKENHIAPAELKGSSTREHMKKRGKTERRSRRRSLRLENKRGKRSTQEPVVIDLTLDSESSAERLESAPSTPLASNRKPTSPTELLLSDPPPPRKVKRIAPLNKKEKGIVKAITTGKGKNVPIVTVEEANIKLTKEDLSHLRGTRWLHDEILNCYIALLNMRNIHFFANKERKTMFARPRPKTFIFNTFFYTRLTDTGYHYPGVKRWTRRSKVDVLALDLVLVPINLGNAHWILAGIDMSARRILYLDSMHHGDGSGIIKNLRRWLYDEVCDKHGIEKAKEVKVDKFKCSENHYTLQTLSGGHSGEKLIPQQFDSGSCGVFTVQYAAYLEKGEAMDFRQSHMATLRGRMALDLFYRKIL